VLRCCAGALLFWLWGHAEAGAQLAIAPIIVAAGITAAASAASTGASLYGSNKAAKAGQRSGKDEWRDAIAVETGAAGFRQRELEAASVERSMGYLEDLLGSDRQLGATPGPDLSKYTYRYQLDPGLFGANVNQYTPKATGYHFTDPANQFPAQRDQANGLLEQAQAAAERGDMATAEQLYARAQEVAGFFGGRGLNGPLGDMMQLVPTDATERSMAEARAFSPTGQVVGEEVRRARGLQERGEIYDRFYEELTDDSLMALETERTLTQRQLAGRERADRARMGELAAARGAARNPIAEEALQARLSDVYAGELADVNLEIATKAAEVHGEASRFLEEYTDRLAGSSAELARWFASTAPGFREEHQSRLDNLALTAAQLHAQTFNLAAERMSRSSEAAAERSFGMTAASLELLASISGTVLGAVLGPRTPSESTPTPAATSPRSLTPTSEYARPSRF
jgi:hypothetical protein